MHRRQALAGTGATIATALAGCLDSGPNPGVPELLEPEPSVVSVRARGGGEFSATVDNTGDAGNIRLELYYLSDNTVDLPSNPAPFVQADSPEWIFDRANTTAFDSGQQREASLTATEQRPADWPDFIIRAFPASYGCLVENSGDAGDITVRLELVEDPIPAVEVPDPRQVSLDGGQSTEVTFDVLLPPRAEYEITAEPA